MTGARPLLRFAWVTSVALVASGCAGLLAVPDLTFDEGAEQGQPDGSPDGLAEASPVDGGGGVESGGDATSAVPETTALIEITGPSALRPYGVATVGPSDAVLVGADGFDDPGTDRNAVALRLGLSGSVKWAKRFSGTSNDQFLVLASSGATLHALGVTRTVYTGATRNTDVLWVQLDPNDGSTIASRHVGTDTDDDVFSAVVQQDGIVLSGHTNNGEDAYLTKLTDAGAATWARRWSTAGSESLQWIGAAQDGLVAAGFSSVTAGGTVSPVLTKVDAAGAHVWSRRIAGLVGVGRLFTGARTSDGYVLAGAVATTAGGMEVPFALKVSSDGSTITWAKAYVGAGAGAWRSATLVPADATYGFPETAALSGTAGNGAVVSRISTADGSLVAARSIAKTPGNFVSERELLFQRAEGGFGFFFRSFPDSPKVGLALPNRFLEISDCSLAVAPSLGVADLTGLTSEPLSPAVTALTLTIGPTGAQIGVADLAATPTATCN